VVTLKHRYLAFIPHHVPCSVFYFLFYLNSYLIENTVLVIRDSLFGRSSQSVWISENNETDVSYVRTGRGLKCLLFLFAFNWNRMLWTNFCRNPFDRSCPDTFRLVEGLRDRNENRYNEINSHLSKAKASKTYRNSLYVLHIYQMITFLRLNSLWINSKT
jgi:hypothetical protein